jgi:hypothetical protein
MQYGFDLIFPPDKIANISTGSIELVPNSILRVGSVICRLLVLEMRSERSWREISLKN